MQSYQKFPKDLILKIIYGSGMGIYRDLGKLDTTYWRKEGEEEKKVNRGSLNRQLAC